MDKVLKQRLIGASILIALAVIFIPMLFDAPEDDFGDRQMRIDIPDPPANRPSVRRMPLDPDSARAPAQGASQVGSAGPDSASAVERSSDEVMAEIEGARGAGQEGEPTQTPARQAPDRATQDREPAPSAPESEPEAAQEPLSSSSSGDSFPNGQDPLTGGDWLLQVASFSVEENATDLVDQLTRLGHVASVNRMARGATTLHRVLTGPYSSRRDAERAKGQIERTVTGVAPVVRGNPSAQNSPGDGNDRPAGFSVQVGSFASRNNAVRLLGQLEGQDFEAFIHEDLSGRRTIWRVRVGLTETREDATELLSEVADRTALEGLVVSHP